MFSLPGFDFIDSTLKLPGTPLPVRTVVAQLGGGRVMFSPSSILTQEQLASAGSLTDIVAPNLSHAGGVQRAFEAHPNARLWGPPGIREKFPQLQWRVLGEDPWPYDELEPIRLKGMANFNEWVFLHAPSRTLFVADLAFNLVDVKGLGGRIIFGLFGTWRRFAVSRLFMRFVTDRAQFTESMKDLVQREFDNLVPSHGSPLVGNARAKLIASLNDRGIKV